MRILLLDNYDSFTYNLAYLIRRLGYGEELDILRNDAFPLEEVKAYDKILLSPGPGIPAEAGLMPQVIQRYASSKSILGICLGHQAIGEAFGGKLHNLAEVHHGVAATLTAVPDVLFEGLPTQFEVGRYHSWVIEEVTLPEELEIIARTADQYIMAIRHKNFDLRGVQFHPESILTEHGAKLIQNWLQS
ncbi:MAG: aminodeoxychorismate/anthranilate synthase component II [Bacteroidetes bacterium]|nr:aminodeoxychorismate/anthranilate synthase component II [Bacteroidota bacterium]